MTDAQLRAARMQMRHGGEPTQAVLDELDRAVRATLRAGRLPNALSPEGHWEGEVPNDLRQRWITEKLLVNGENGDGLRVLLEMAESARAFSSMARRSFYHWLLSARERSQATNIYKRLLAVLDGHPDVFRVAVESRRGQDRYWQAAGDPDREIFSKSDRELAAAAMAAGEIKIVRYGASSKRLSPLISSTDLQRFAEVVMKTLDRALSPSQLMRALATRLDLGDIEAISIDDMSVEPEGEAVERTGLREVAITALALMSPRAPEILVRLSRGQKGQDIAESMSVSPATVSAEKAGANAVLSELSEDDDEMGALLKCLLDLLYEASDD